MNRNGLGVDIHDKGPCHDQRLGVPLRASDYGLDASDQLVFVKRLWDIIVGAETESSDFGFDTGETGKDQNWSRNPCRAQRVRIPTKPAMHSNMKPATY